MSDDLAAPFTDGLLDVGDGHRMYWRAHGNPDAPVVAILHGGPGSGHNVRSAQFFDPAEWRIMLFDQRGCGRSTPQAATHDNDTAHLVADMESLRQSLDIDRWTLFGGSWGTRLALSYGVAHPSRCAGFLLRAVFLARPADIAWYLWDVRCVFPESHARFLDVVERVAGRRPQTFAELLALTAPILRPGHPLRMTLAVAWDEFEFSLISVNPMAPAPTDEASVAQAAAKSLTLTTLEHHYMANVLPHERAILDDVHRIAHLPCEIVHGRYDMICPLDQAWLLAARWPAARLAVAPMSGHWPFEPEMAVALQQGSDRLLEQLTRAAA